MQFLLTVVGSAGSIVLGEATAPFGVIQLHYGLQAGGYPIQTVACLTRAATRSTSGKIGLAVFDRHGEATVARHRQDNAAIAALVERLCLRHRLVHQYHYGNRAEVRLHSEVRHVMAAERTALGVAHHARPKVEP